jgi:hypothetical protein
MDQAISKAGGVCVFSQIQNGARYAVFTVPAGGGGMIFDGAIHGIISVVFSSSKDLCSLDIPDFCLIFSHSTRSKFQMARLLHEITS